MKLFHVEDNQVTFIADAFDVAYGPDAKVAENLAGCRLCDRGLPSHGAIQFVSIENGVAIFTCGRLAIVSNVLPACKIKSSS